MEELFSIIGKLYVDIYNMQKVLEMLQKANKEKDLEILELKKSRMKEKDG